MIFIKTMYERFIESENLESYDNKVLNLFIASGIIGQITMAFNAGKFVHPTDVQLSITIFTILCAGIFGPIVLYYLNGALTHFFSSKLGGSASRIELRIGHVIGSSPVIFLNACLLIIYILLPLLGYSPYNAGMTALNPGENFNFIKYLSGTCSLFAVFLTSRTIARLSKFSIIKGFISCYWFLIIGFPFWLYLYFKIKM